MKTLKDLKGLWDLVSAEELKQEAIKWVKFYDEQPGEEEYDMCNLKVIEFIKEFFNITKEDLK